jgi:hypothetical protein
LRRPGDPPAYHSASADRRAKGDGSHHLISASSSAALRADHNLNLPLSDSAALTSGTPKAGLITRRGEAASGFSLKSQFTATFIILFLLRRNQPSSNFPATLIHGRGVVMGLIAFLAVVGALTIYAFHTLFAAPGWGLLTALVLFVLGMTAPDRIQPARQGDLKSLPAADERQSERLPVLRNASAVFVASIAVMIGVAMGWLIRGADNNKTSTNSLVRLENEGLVATVPLKAALDTIPSSNRLVPIPGGKPAQFRALMTFQMQEGGYCRQYELALNARDRTAGVACRIPSGDWSVMLQFRQPPSTSGRIVPASGQNTVLNAAINALIYGDPLVGGAEAAIISNGWRK